MLSDASFEDHCDRYDDRGADNAVSPPASTATKLMNFSATCCISEVGWPTISSGIPFELLLLPNAEIN